MRGVFTAAAAASRWRRRRTARIAMAVALVLAAPFVGGPGRDDPAGEQPAGEQHAPDHSRVRVVPVPLADPAVADLLQPGDLVDLVGTADPDSPAGPVVVARSARIRDTPVGLTGNRSILVEVPEADAARLASTAAGTPLAVLVHG